MHTRISIIIVTAYINLIACSHQDKQKQPAEIPKDSMAVDKTGRTPTDSTKVMDTSTSITPTKKTDNPKEIPDKTKKEAGDAAEKTKPNRDITGDAGKKPSHRTDSSSAVKSEKTPSDDSKLVPASVADNSKAFAPKYGLIPWDANENNITSFKNAFPDKQTLVKINFDADADAQMQSTKTQVIAALKKAGYKNVSDHSQTFHPTRIAKDIHYELQRDGSVIIWVPPNSQQ